MSTRRTHPQDNGLQAVARVRSVRERDSRIGLRQALVATEEREAGARRAQARVDDAPVFVHGSAQDFHVRRTTLVALAAEARRSQELAAASRANTEEARRRWQHDRGRLRAVELLLERRAEARRAEAMRRESLELDDVAGRMWLRRRQQATEGGDAA